LRHAVEAALWVGLYGMGFTGAERALNRAARILAGEFEADLLARTRRFYETELKETFLPGGRDAVRRHQAEGHVVALLTSTSVYLARCAAEELAIEHVLANVFTVRDGRFTGELETPLCYGVGKVSRARAFCEARGLSLDGAWFYTDSYSDLPMLQAVTHRVVVQPDPRLLRAAKAAGWDVVSWEAL
jgi:HAD superfamily hydrolase (TIGR01490 family)